MTYESVDKLQNSLADTVFAYAFDRKKAAGRALGTLVEIITYYTLRAWGLRDAVAIERRLPEFANAEITHNVEYSLHPILARTEANLSPVKLPLSAAKLRKVFLTKDEAATLKLSGRQLLTSKRVLRNSCTIADSETVCYVAHLDSLDEKGARVSVILLHNEPYAIVECKRVGVEEGTKKGPQTIEKAKQGAYVARTVSSLQRVRLNDGTAGGLIESPDGSFRVEPYDALLRDIVQSDSPDLLRDFVLTIGVVSNHGNWFTSDDPNKEMKVLAQSYDWLLFLTDRGLSEFIDQLLLHPAREFVATREAFLKSYGEGKTRNRFTKVQMDLAADAVLQAYFKRYEDRVSSWFTVVSPDEGSLTLLRSELSTLSQKNWRSIKGL